MREAPCVRMHWTHISQCFKINTRLSLNKYLELYIYTHFHIMMIYEYLWFRCVSFVSRQLSHSRYGMHRLTNLPREVVDFQEALSSLLPEWCHCSIASKLTQLTLETPRKKTLAGTFRKHGSCHFWQSTQLPNNTTSWQIKALEYLLPWHAMPFLLPHLRCFAQNSRDVGKASRSYRCCVLPGPTVVSIKWSHEHISVGVAVVITWDLEYWETFLQISSKNALMWSCLKMQHHHVWLLTWDTKKI